MTLEEFSDLFARALEVAAENAEKALGKRIPRKYDILLFGAGHSGDILAIEKAVHALFIGENQFYRIIDIAVQQVSPAVTRVFVRVSGHDPVPFEQTWNTPKGYGPFKQIMAQIQADI